MHILQSEFKAKNDRKQGTIKFGKQVNMVKFLMKNEKFAREYISPKDALVLVLYSELKY
jgi:hypothetical protein